MPFSAKLGTPFRALESFGAGGALSAKAEVYYQYLLGPRHLGNVTDLLVAKLRSLGRLNRDSAEEIRFRSLLTVGAYLAEREGMRGHRDWKESTFSRPLVLEVGLDEERLVVSFGTIVSRLQAVSLSGPQNAPPALNELRTIADGVAVRFQKATLRFEVVCVFSLIAEDPVSREEALTNFEWVEFSKEEEVETPEVKSYQELGNLDATELLKEDDLRVKEAEAQKSDEKSTLKNGGKGFGNFLKKVLGGKDEDKDEKFLVQGDEFKMQDEEVWELKRLAEQNQALQKTVEEYRRKLEGLGNDRSFAARTAAERAREDTPDQNENELEGEPGTGWVPPTEAKPKPKPKTEEEFAQRGVEDDLEIQELLESDPLREVQELEAATELLPKSVSELKPDEEAERLFRDLAKGELNEVIEKAKKEYVQVCPEFGSEKAKKWAEGFMKDLFEEKARIQEKMKQLSTSVRQKEHEFKVAQERLLEEVKNRDKLVKQKGQALVRARDQLAQVMENMERTKSGTSSNKEEQAIKQKYAMSQRLLGQAKKETEDALKRGEEFKRQLGLLKGGPTAAEVTTLKAQRDRLQKQVDDTKRINLQLIEKINQASNNSEAKARGASPQVVDELKRKLDASNRISAKAQAQTDQLQIKLEEHQREESRLKKELFQLQTQLAQAKQQAAKAALPTPNGGSSGNSSPPATPASGTGGSKPNAA